MGGVREGGRKEREMERGRGDIPESWSFLLLLKKLHLFLSLIAKATLLSHCSEWETCLQSATAIQQTLFMKTHKLPTR